MRTPFIIASLFAFLGSPLLAQSFPYPLSCTGQSPDWSLMVTERGAEFDLVRQSAMDVVLDTQAQGAEWPRALTLVGRGDSAIVLLEHTACETGNLTTRILTQRGETPILLTGCCSVPAH